MNVRLPTFLSLASLAAAAGQYDKPWALAGTGLPSGTRNESRTGPGWKPVVHSGPIGECRRRFMKDETVQKAAR